MRPATGMKSGTPAQSCATIAFASRPPASTHPPRRSSAPMARATSIASQVLGTSGLTTALPNSTAVTARQSAMTAMVRTAACATAAVRGGLRRYGLAFHLGRIDAGARGAVHLRAMVVRALCGLDVLRLAAPRLQRGRLQRAAVRERELPRMRALRVHRVQVRCRVLVRLTAGEEDDARHGRRDVLVEALERPVGKVLDARAVRSFVPGEHHVRLQQRAEDVDALVEELRVERVEHAARDVIAALDRVRAV